jgi:hypothetical protein
MAETKDYLSGLLQDSTIDNGKRTPAEYLEIVKQKLIALGAKPGTTQYENAFMSYLSIKGTGSPGTLSGGFEFSDTGKKALDYLKNKLTAKEVEDQFGIDPLSAKVGKDVKGAWRSQSGELIPNNDQYQRGKEGEREVDPNTGLPLYSAYAPFATITTGQQGGMLKLEDLDVVPESAFWYLKPEFNRRLDAKGNVESYQRDIPAELINIGFVPGAKVTPELAAKYREYQLSRMSPELRDQVTGVSTTGLTSDGAPSGTSTPTGNVTGTPTGYDPVTKTFKASDGRQFTDQQAYVAYEENIAGKKAERQSAYDLLYSQFKQYGLESLVEPLKGLIMTDTPKSEFILKLRETPQYQKRFAANAARVAKGLVAIDEATYLGLEDQYQNIMRNYGLPAEYYTRGDLGVQEGFTKLIANDVSSTELEDRVLTAQQRVLNSNPEVLASLKQFYPDITNGDILAYTLDPTKGLTDIKRKVTAAEIGGAATQAGLGITGTRAEELSAAGINKAAAQEGFSKVAQVAPRGGELAAIYGESPYTQQTAEQEFFGLAGSTEAAKQRKKLTSLETAAFSGSAGAGAIARDRAGTL